MKDGDAVDVGRLNVSPLPTFRTIAGENERIEIEYLTANFLWMSVKGSERDLCLRSRLLSYHIVSVLC